MPARITHSPVGLIAQQNGTFGAVYMNTTTAVVGDFWCIQAVGGTAAVFSSLTATGLDGSSTAGLTISDGTAIYGSFQGFTLTSGAVFAYRSGLG